IDSGNRYVADPILNIVRNHALSSESFGHNHRPDFLSGGVNTRRHSRWPPAHYFKIRIFHFYIPKNIYLCRGLSIFMNQNRSFPYISFVVVLCILHNRSSVVPLYIYLPLILRLMLRPISFSSKMPVPRSSRLRLPKFWGLQLWLALSFPHRFLGQVLKVKLSN